MVTLIWGKIVCWFQFLSSIEMKVNANEKVQTNLHIYSLSRSKRLKKCKLVTRVTLDYVPQ